MAEGQLLELELGGGEPDSVGGLGPRSFWGVMMMMMMMMMQGDKLQSPAVRQEERRFFQRAVQYISDLWQLKWVNGWF